MVSLTVNGSRVSTGGMSIIIREEYWVVAAGRAGVTVFLNGQSELTTKVDLAQHFGSDGDAARALKAARSILGNYDWRVFKGIHGNPAEGGLGAWLRCGTRAWTHKL